MLTDHLQELHGCLAIVKQSTALLALHITLRFSSTSSLSHPSCRNLTITYDDDGCLLEEVRMPHLEELTIVTSIDNAPLRLTLVDTPISSLQLTCEFPYEDIYEAVHVSWVDGVIRLLRSAPHLERFQISAPSFLVSGLSEALAEDPNLCIELNTFIIDGPTGIELDAKGYIAKNVEEIFEKSRSDVAASIDQRRLRRSKN